MSHRAELRLGTWKVRLAGILLVAATAYYLPWLVRNLNWRAPWLSLPFAAASLLTSAVALVTVHNHWRYSVPEERVLPSLHTPTVAVVIPTFGEPPSMVYETCRSVLTQDYPEENMWLVLSDDGHRASIRAVALQLQREHPKAYITYHEPPRRGDPRRRGDAKAGNLNSVLDAMQTWPVWVPFVETRDADDRVGDPQFLRKVLGQLVAEPKVAFVQTVKEAEVSPGDPFGNLEPLFYHRAMLAKNSANAVFPCGSGLVWRREALEEIGGFPTWNLVEDLQSGVEALRRGWRGLYLPIVGAVGQSAPEDIPNTVKQRGTWAIDTMRLSFWGERRGLSLSQHLQFSELGLFYLQGFAILVFAITPLFALLAGVYPIAATPGAYFRHLGPYVGAIELLLLCLADGIPFQALWRARQTWLGMAPVYVRATIIALQFGPKRKPAYRVTRKEAVFRWHWRGTAFQLVLFVLLIGAMVYHAVTHAPAGSADAGSILWAGYFVVVLSRTVRNSWHGLGFRRAVLSLFGRATAGPTQRRQPVA